MQNNIRKDYLWNTVGVFAQNAISPLLLIAITRINGIYDSGLFSFAFSVSIIFWAFGMWGGRTYQVSDVSREFSNRSYVMVRVLLASIMLLGAIAFSLINQYDTTKTAIILALVLFKVVESVADAVHGILQVHDRLYIAGKSLLYKAVVGFSVFVVIDVATKSILLSSIGIVLVNVLLFIFYDVRIARKFETIKFSGKIRHYVKDAIVIIRRVSPVAAVILLSMFSLNIPRYFIDLYHGEEIGYFGIIAMPITLIGLVMTFILQPNVVALSRDYKTRSFSAFHDTVSKIARITVGIGFVLLMATYAVGVPILNLVFNVNFSDYKAALMIIVAGGVINALVMILINVLTIMRHFKYQFYTLLVTNIALVIASAMVVREEGLLGGTILFTMASTLQVLLLLAIYWATLSRVKMQLSS